MSAMKYWDGTQWVKVPSMGLPLQTGNAGKVVTTDGTNASWGYINGNNRGNATIAAGSLSVTVNHGLGSAPLRIDTAPDCNISSVNATSFTLSILYPQSTDTVIAWETNKPITNINYLNDVADVDASTAVAGDILMFNGTNWINSPLFVGYSSGQSSFTLPPNPVNGYKYEVIGDGTPWTINAGTGYTIQFNGQSGTTLTSVQGYECIALSYIGSNVWNVTSYDAKDRLSNNCVLYLPGQGTNNSRYIPDLSSRKKNTIANGDAKISTTQYKFGNSSIYLDGTGDNVEVLGSTEDFKFGSNAFSVSVWVYYLSLPAVAKIIVDTRPVDLTSVNKPVFYINSTQQMGFYSNNSIIISGSTVLTTSTWYHVAWIRSNGLTKAYLNGLQEGSTYTDTTIYTTGGDGCLVVGADTAGGEACNVYISELQIWNGVAISPTVPTKPLIGGITLS